MGSPPPLGSKKEVFRFRSVRSIVIAPANTGRDRSRRIVVINTDQTNSGTWSMLMPGARILITVDMKLIEPRIDDAPAKCSEKIARSTDPPLCAALLAKGGYTVQPVPTPLSISPLISKKVNEGGKSQKLMLFIRGKAMSGLPSIRGSSQFPKPPIIMGITIKKIITNA